MHTPQNDEEELASLREVVAQMRQAFSAVEQEREALRGEVRVLRVERDLLAERLKAFMRKLFAAKSEARGTEQSELLFNEAEALSASAAAASEEALDTERVEIPAHKRAKRGRKPLDPALPREVIRHELPESERVCPHDGAALQEIGVEASEQLDIIPQQVRVIRHERVKYACPCCDQGLKLTPVPARIIPKGLLSEAALTWVISAKYQDGLPLYRQAGLLARFGGDISRNTLACSVVRAGEAVQPIINLMRDELLEGELILGDETELQVLKEPGRPAQRKSYLWVQMGGAAAPVRLFTYAPSRSAATALELYAGAQAGSALMSDGYESYGQVAKTYGLVHLGCWAHSRRRFVEAEAALPKPARSPDQPATQFIAAIGELYVIEARARELSREQRHRLRQEHSRGILDRIQALLLAHLNAVLPHSLLGKALHYLHDQWPRLVRYVDDGAYPIDNNACENAIRPFVIGRKNWLFSDTQGGAKASANLYSLIETARVNNVEPYRYLQALFTTLPRARTVEDYEALLPWRIPLRE
jgi:transposase